MVKKVVTFVLSLNTSFVDKNFKLKFSMNKNSINQSKYPSSVLLISDYLWSKLNQAGFYLGKQK